jgi:hypothetical protein
MIWSHLNDYDTWLPSLTSNSAQPSSFPYSAYSSIACDDTYTRRIVSQIKIDISLPLAPSFPSEVSIITTSPPNIHQRLPFSVSRYHGAANSSVAAWGLYDSLVHVNATTDNQPHEALPISCLLFEGISINGLTIAHVHSLYIRCQR